MKLYPWLKKRLSKYSPRAEIAIDTVVVNVDKIPWKSVFYKNRIDFSIAPHLIEKKPDLCNFLKDNEIAIVCKKEEDVEIYSKRLMVHQSVYKSLQNYELPKLLGVCKVLPKLQVDISDWTHIFVDFTKDTKELRYTPGARSAHRTLAHGSNMWYLYRHLPKSQFKSIVEQYFEGEILQYVPIKTPKEIPSVVDCLIRESAVIEQVCSDIDKEVEKDLSNKVKKRLTQAL